MFHGNRLVSSLTPLLPFFLIFVLCAGWSLPAFANSDEEANRLLVEAVHLIRRADNTYDARESVRLLRGADQLLKKIVANYPQSAIAVQLSTHQLIGDFDVSEFEGRVRALSCERGSYVEDFLADYGVASSTGPLTEACFLYRMENLLVPVEQPMMTARPDWLDLAVDYDLTGQHERARGIILPYLSLLRKNGAGSDTQDSYVMLAKALVLTGANDQAQQVAERISDCSGRLSYMMTALQTDLWHDDADAAKTLADQLRDYADLNQCSWQQGLVVQALVLTGREKEAQAVYEKVMSRQFEGVADGDRAQNTPPELAVAASMGGDPPTALNLTRMVMEREPGVVPRVIENLASRGETQAAHDFLNEIKDPAHRARALAALIGAVSQREETRKMATPWMEEFTALRTGSPQASDQAVILSALARAQKVFNRDDRWRGTFQAALNAAERADENVRAPLIIELAKTLAYIKTGRPLLD